MLNYTVTVVFGRLGSYIVPKKRVRVEGGGEKTHPGWCLQQQIFNSCQSFLVESVYILVLPNPNLLFSIFVIKVTK